MQWIIKKNVKSNIKDLVTEILKCFQTFQAFLQNSENEHLL